MPDVSPLTKELSLELLSTIDKAVLRLAKVLKTSTCCALTGFEISLLTICVQKHYLHLFFWYISPRHVLRLSARSTRIGERLLALQLGTSSSRSFLKWVVDFMNIHIEAPLNGG